MVKSRKPMVIVMRAVVWLATSSGGLEFVGKCRRPLLPGEVPLLRELDGEREGLGLSGLREHGALIVARQRGQRCETL
jgi:hypothetical protein